MAEAKPEPEQDQELIDLLSAISPSKKTVDLDLIPPAEEPEQPVTPVSTPVQQAVQFTPVPPPVQVVTAPASVQVPIQMPDPDNIEPPVIDRPPIIEPEMADAPTAILAEAPAESDLVRQTLPPEAVKDQLGAKMLLAEFGTTVKKIIQNHEADRDQVEEAIAFYEAKVRNAVDTKGMSVYAEGWVNLVKIKSDINANAVGALDAISKLLAASKGNDVIINLNGMKKGDLDLEKLLSQQEDDRI